MLGVTIGVILILKLAIIRYFKHFSGVIPYLGCGLLWCTTMVVSLSVPFAFKESYWSQGAVGGSAFSVQNMERLRRLLPTAGFPQAAPLAELSQERQLRSGRKVLLTQCVTCHDLKTILMRPRTPADWVRTVERMANRQIFDAIEEQQQWAVSAYLIAISPELQNSAKARRGRADARRRVDAGGARGDDRTRSGCRGRGAGCRLRPRIIRRILYDVS
jgi:mono/diheme cytochrome c family protein